VTAALKPGQLVAAVGLVDEFGDDEKACTRAATEAVRAAGVEEQSIKAAVVWTVRSNRRAVIVTGVKR
jgi:hypothetical protein